MKTNTKKEYDIPEFSVVYFEDDIITTSITTGLDKNPLDPDTEKGDVDWSDFN